MAGMEQSTTRKRGEERGGPSTSFDIPYDGHRYQKILNGFLWDMCSVVTPVGTFDDAVRYWHFSHEACQTS